MGKMTIQIAAALTPAIIEEEDIFDSCSSVRTITVKANGSDKHVSITSSGDGVFGQNLSEIISADKTYTLYVEGTIDTSAEANLNTTSGTVTLRVREGTSTGVLLIRSILGRIHTGNYC